MNYIDSPKLGGGAAPPQLPSCGGQIVPTAYPPSPRLPRPWGYRSQGHVPLTLSHSRTATFTKRRSTHHRTSFAVPGEIPGPPDRPTQARYSHVTDAASHQPITAEHGRAEPNRTRPGRAAAGPTSSTILWVLNCTLGVLKHSQRDIKLHL